MADIKHAGPELTEGDGISYRGLAGSMIVLAVIGLVGLGAAMLLPRSARSAPIADART